jgi:exodeoxyribonuclease V gamma subunit
MLNVIQSQRIELLVACVLDFFESQPIGVFEPRQILIPSHGVGVWLRQQLASHQGICAQVSTDFMGSFQWKLYSRILKDQVSERAPLSASVMQWRLFAYLTDMHENPDADGMLYAQLEPLFQKIKTQSTALQARRQIWYLAEQIAQVFAAYVVYRPEWLRLWGKGGQMDLRAEFARIPIDDRPPEWQILRSIEMQQWQAVLWRQLFAEVFESREALMERFWQILADEPVRRRDLPRSIAVFGVVQLPPAELMFLRRLAQYTNIQIFHYNPSQEYWADSVDPKWLVQYAQRYPERAALRESRHELLTRMGKQARDVFGLLSQLSGGEEGQWDDVFPDAYPDTLLGKIQQDILYLNPTRPNSIAINPADQSIQVHVCHSMLRQLEVLREELVAWLAADESRQPSDIVVLIPNLAGAAPLIRSVFERPSRGQRRAQVSIPFEITGLAPPETESLWQAVSGFFNLFEGRFAAEQLLDWLALPPIQRAYGLSLEGVQRLGELLVDAGFRRGFDAVHLAQSLSPNDHDYRFSFDFALQRLLLGMAMPTRQVHAGVLAYPDLKHDDFVWIAALRSIAQDLTRARELLATPARPIPEWVGIIEALMYARFGDAIDSQAWDQVFYGLEELRGHVSSSNLPRVPLPLRFVLDELEANITQTPAGSEPSGRLTFARLGTLRPLPYQLVVMLGLEAGQFPARDQISSVDLMKALPSKAGDRSRYDDEQGAFLDGLLLAQQACWLFYNGFDVADTEVRQPAGPVQELLDFIAKQLVVEVAAGADPYKARQAALAQQIVCHHSLQPFEPENFLPPDPAQPVQLYRQPRALGEVWYQVACHLQGRDPQLETPTLWADQLPSEQAAIPTDPVPLARIIAQLQRPAQHFLQARRIHNLKRAEQLSAFEPLLLDRLDEYQMRAWHLSQGEQRNVDLLMDRLPVGAVKDASFVYTEKQARLMEWRVAQYAEQHGKAGHDLPTDQLLRLGDWKLLIGVPDADDGVWLSRVEQRLRGKHRLRFWLEHLAWTVWRGQQGLCGGKRILVMADQAVELPALDAAQAEQWLLDWLTVWQQAAQTPWVLPPDLALDSSQGLKMNKQGEVGYNAEGLLHQWLGDAFHQTILPSENDNCVLHPDWQLILQGQDAEALLIRHLELHLLRLYQPIIEHSIALGLPDGADA